MRTLDNIIQEAKLAREADDKVKLKATLTELDRLPNGITQATMAELRMSPMFISNIIDEGSEPEVQHEPVRSNSSNISLDEMGRKIRSLNGTVGKSTIEIGRWLNLAKEEIPFGDWAVWVSKNTSFSRGHAATLIKTATVLDNPQLKRAEELRPEMMHEVALFSGSTDTVNTLIDVVLATEKDNNENVAVRTIRAMRSVLVGVHESNAESLSELMTLLSDSRSRYEMGEALKGIKHRAQPKSARSLIDAYAASLIEEKEDDDYDVFDDDDPNVKSVADFFGSEPSTATVIDFPSPPFELSDERYESIIQGADDMVVKEDELFYSPMFSDEERKELKRKSFASNTRCAAEALWDCLETTTVDELVESMAKEEINFSRLDTYIDKLTKIRDKLADKNEKQKYEVI